MLHGVERGQLGRAMRIRSDETPVCPIRTPLDSHQTSTRTPYDPIYTTATRPFLTFQNGRVCIRTSTNSAEFSRLSLECHTTNANLDSHGIRIYFRANEIGVERCLCNGRATTSYDFIQDRTTSYMTQQYRHTIVIRHRRGRTTIERLQFIRQFQLLTTQSQ